MPLSLLHLIALTTPPPATEYRFDFAHVRGGPPSYLQLQEVRLYAVCGSTPLRIQSAANPGGRSPNGQPVTDLVDGDVITASSKWVDLAFNNPNPTSTLIITLSEVAMVDRYEFFTANDVPKRDPTEWQMYRKPTGSSEWQLVATHKFEPPLDRHASYGTFYLDGQSSSNCDPRAFVASPPPPPSIVAVVPAASLSSSSSSSTVSSSLSQPPITIAIPSSTGWVSSVTSPASSGAANISHGSVVLCAVIVLALAGASHMVGLSLLANAIVLAVLQAFAQIFAIGGILYPIMVFDGPFLVLPYLALMGALAAREVEARLRRKYTAVRIHLLIAIGGGIIVSLLLISVLEPFCEARCMIPIGGAVMLMSIEAIPIGIDTYLKSLQQDDGIHHVLLACGATRWEAGMPSIRKAMTAALTLELNSQKNLLSLVCVPGIMAGAILSGSSPLVAARYQVVVICLGIFSLAMTLCLALAAATSAFGVFDDEHRFCGDRVHTQKGRAHSSDASAEEPTLSDPALVFRHIIRRTLQSAGRPHDGSESTSCAEQELEAAPQDGEDKSFTLLDEHGITDDMVFTARGCQIKLAGNNEHVLVREASLGVHAEGSMAVRGPSGCGKSLFLRALARIDGIHAGQLRLSGVSAAAIKARHWRAEVCYVRHRGGQGLSGTPRGLLDQVLGLRTQRRRATSATHDFDAKAPNRRSNDQQQSNDHPLGTARETRERFAALVESVKLDAQLLSKPWSSLSAAEAQQVYLCMILSLQPRVLLLDDCISEVTDSHAAQRIEACVRKSGASAVWVTADDAQAERVAIHGSSFFMDDSSS